jgi:hypothetical protein
LALLALLIKLLKFGRIDLVGFMALVLHVITMEFVKVARQDYKMLQNPIFRAAAKFTGDKEQIRNRAIASLIFSMITSIGCIAIIIER